MKREGRTPGVERGGRVRELFGIHELALRSLRFVIFIASTKETPPNLVD